VEIAKALLKKTLGCNPQKAVTSGSF